MLAAFSGPGLPLFGRQNPLGRTRASVTNQEKARVDGYVIALRPRFEPVLERVYGNERAVRLSPAVLDMHVLITSRQPATKQQFDTLRGSDRGCAKATNRWSVV